MIDHGRKRVIIENVAPEIDAGSFPIKRVVGEKVVVSADIFADGHDLVDARLLYRQSRAGEWTEHRMTPEENDRWSGEFSVAEVGIYYYTLEAWIDRFKTWQRDLKKKLDAGQEVKIDLLIGREYLEEAIAIASDAHKKELMNILNRLREPVKIETDLTPVLEDQIAELMRMYPDRALATTYDKELTVIVDRQKALFSAWYERFPRSTSPDPNRSGRFKDCEPLLPEIAKMGFDVLYLPPIHPIGKARRRGKNNSSTATEADPGSPWAIGSTEGGHKAVHPQLGSLADFESLVQKAKDFELEIAMDLAFQCSADHPYIKEHPEWFKRRPDGTIQFAENPPKKYEDIFPFNFETDDWQALWRELKSIVDFWIEKGIRIFRVDNPHTKPFHFWAWLVSETKKDHPEVIFLAEAFTRPKVMHYLAKLGFTQSYTYFTWRNTKKELIDYMTELTQTRVKEYFRPNFWPNTPDILPENLQFGGRTAFMTRLVLAATLSSSYGIYGPAFEFCMNQAIPGKEEYLDSEKYEIKHWNWEALGDLKDFIARVNRIRRENAALHTTWNLKFYDTENDYLLAYAKTTEDLSNVILVVVNLDLFHVQSGWLRIPVHDLGISTNQSYLVHDLLSDDKYIWQGERNYVELDPKILPANIFSLKKKLRREADFDYFL